MDGNIRPPIPGPQAGWQNMQQVFLNDSDTISPPEASGQQQHAPHSTSTLFLTEPQRISPYGDAYRDNLSGFTESLVDPACFGQTGAAMPPQHSLATVNPAMEMGMTQHHSFQPMANPHAGVNPNTMNNFYVPPAAGYNTNEVPGPGFGTTPMPTPNTPTKQGKEKVNWTPEKDSLLLRMKGEGRSYPEIIVEMIKRWPSMGGVNPNQLSKRMSRIQDQALERFPQAVKTRAIPRINACIKEIADSLGVDDDTYTEITSELKRIVPNLIQKKLTARRNRQLKTSSMRGAHS